LPPSRAIERWLSLRSSSTSTRLLNACPGAFRDLAHAALLTGCRYGELCRLKVADYNRDVGTLSIRIGKGGKGRHVTLTEEGPELIETLVAGRASHDHVLLRDDGLPWGKSQQKRLIDAACAQAGITPAVSRCRRWVLCNEYRRSTRRYAPAGTDTDFSAGLTPALIGSIRRECLDHMIVFDALGHHGPGHPRDLVGKRDGGDLRRTPRQQCREPGPMLGAMDLGIADDGERPGHERT